MKKILLSSCAGLLSLAGLGFAYLSYRTPNAEPALHIKVPMTPERIARGKYLYTLGDCDGCHTPRDLKTMYAPAIESERGKGQVLPASKGPVRLVLPNITPDRETGIGAWTDGEKIRAIREGIGRDGRALFPMMPYTNYRNMSDDDVQALVAYLNTLEPKRNRLPRTEVGMPLSLMMSFFPRPVRTPVPNPDPSSELGYGQYLATLGSCDGCHTPDGSFGPDMAKRFAGGKVMKVLDYTVVTPNITPDAATGIGNWTPEYFLERFARHRGVPVSQLGPNTKEQFTLMPWRTLAQLPDRDLLAIYRYLQSRPPVSNKVTVHPVMTASR